jgi:hypothetical protein
MLIQPQEGCDRTTTCKQVLVPKSGILLQNEFIEQQGSKKGRSRTAHHRCDGLADRHRLDQQIQVTRCVLLAWDHIRKQSPAPHTAVYSVQCTVCSVRVRCSERVRSSSKSGSDNS